MSERVRFTQSGRIWREVVGAADAPAGTIVAESAADWETQSDSSAGLSPMARMAHWGGFRCHGTVRGRDLEGLGMIISTTESVPGRTVSEFLGIVQGNTVRSKNVGKDIGAGLKSMVGGELKSYTAMLTEAREESMKRMMDSAASLGADAVLMVRFTTSAITEGAAELLCYGTAVKFT